MNQLRKVGRNERCPCGSGKKYKACCLRGHEEDDLEYLEVIESGEPGSTPGAPFTFSYEVIRPVGEAPPETEEARARRERRAEEDRETFGSPYTKARELARAAEGLVEDDVRRARWSLRTPANVAAMTTSELQGFLRGLGIDASREAFVALAARQRSAFALADGWGAGRLATHLGVFAGLAAHELWKRFCPERPSTERFEELVEDGLELLLRREMAGACEVWTKAWAMVLPWLEPGHRTTRAAERALGIGPGLALWSRLFALALANLALDDPAWYPTALGLHGWFVDQFADEDVAPRRGRRPEPGVRAELQAHRELLASRRGGG